MRKHRQHGSVTACIAALAGLIAFSIGLAVEFGLAHQTTSRLETVLKTAAGIGARHSEMTRSGLGRVALSAARSGLTSFDEPVALGLSVVETPSDAVLVRISGQTSARSRLGWVFGRDRIKIKKQVEAVRPPIDVALAIDLSFSIQRNGGIEGLRRAVPEFTQYFDPRLDRMAAVTFSTTAHERIELRKDFGPPLAELSASLAAATDAATDEGLRVAKRAIDRATPRPQAYRAVVLFTDGQPTAFADRFLMPDSVEPKAYKGVVAAYINGSSYRGLFRASDGAKIRYFDHAGRAVVAENASFARSIAPRYLPGRLRVDGENIRNAARRQAESWASLLRADGVAVFVIGLDDVDAEFAADHPDPHFLARLANEDGRYDPGKPAGRAYIVDASEDIPGAFGAIAQEILAAAVR